MGAEELAQDQNPQGLILKPVRHDQEEVHGKILVSIML